MSSDDIDNGLDKAYVSPYDKFLYEFDETHQKTPSQLKEIAKHQRIAAMRDAKNTTESKSDIWADF